MMDGLLLGRVVRKASLKRNHLNKEFNEVRRPTMGNSTEEYSRQAKVSAKALNRNKLGIMQEEQGGPFGWRKMNERKSHER